MYVSAGAFESGDPFVQLLGFSVCMYVCGSYNEI